MEIINVPLTNEGRLLSLEKGKGFEIEAEKVRMWRNIASELNKKCKEEGKFYSVRMGENNKHVAGRTL